LTVLEFASLASKLFFEKKKSGLLNFLQRRVLAAVKFYRKCASMVDTLVFFKHIERNAPISMFTLFAVFC